MDAEATRNCENYERIIAKRDETMREVDRWVALVRAQIDQQLVAGGVNRQSRRRAQFALERLEALESRSRLKAERLFARVMNGFDPEVGTFADVQQETAEELAAIFA
jgi:hypothetical protein